jgi:NADH dehydrogenase
VDWGTRELKLADGDLLPFDYLLVGAGAIYADFGIPGVKEYSFFLKSLSEAVNIRSHVLRQFERASAHPELIDEGILNFVIVGGGPTGIELAGSFTELFRHVLPRDYPELDVNRAQVIVLEMMDTVLLPFDDASQRYAERVLKDRGVDLRLGTAVAEIREREAVLEGGDSIPTNTLIWAAGVRGAPLAQALDTELEKGFRIAVEDDLSLPGKPFAFAAGDICGIRDPDGDFYPQVAQVAIQQGKHAARMILRRIDGQDSESFQYADRGIMAIISRNQGIAELAPRFGGFHFRGFLGWAAWLLVHYLYLPGHQNRFQALANWVYYWFTFDRHARLITDMEPSPAELSNRTSDLVSFQEVAEDRESSVRRRIAAEPQAAGEDA